MQSLNTSLRKGFILNRIAKRDVQNATSQLNLLLKPDGVPRNDLEFISSFISRYLSIFYFIFFSKRFFSQMKKF